MALLFVISITSGASERTQEAMQDPQTSSQASGSRFFQQSTAQEEKGEGPPLPYDGLH